MRLTNLNKYDVDNGGLFIVSQISVTPRAQKAEKTMLIAASSLICDRVLIQVITIVLTTPAINAPIKMSAPTINAIANPSSGIDKKAAKPYEKSAWIKITAANGRLNFSQRSGGAIASTHLEPNPVIFGENAFNFS